MKVQNLLVILGLTLSFQAVAKKKYPNVYPYVPMELEGVQGIYYDVRKISQDREFLKNFKEIEKNGHAYSGKTKEKPWSASYWPLSKGTIADPYEENGVPYYADWSWIDWEQNVDEFKERKEKVLSKVMELDEDELAKLAPSEKYDLLLGDLNFDLTHRLWDYMQKWGDKKEFGFKTANNFIGENLLDVAKEYVGFNWGYKNIGHAFRNSFSLQRSLSTKYAKEIAKKDFLSFDEKAYDIQIQKIKNNSTLSSDEKKSSINAIESQKMSDLDEAMSKAITLAWPKAVKKAKTIAPNYVLEKKNSFIAGWEGICNGWATAAGVEPRSRKSVSFTLPNGKKLKFYPADIQGLVSLYYVNSAIQNNVWGNNIDKDGMPLAHGTVSVGLRCNFRRTKKDEWGRKYDHKNDPFNFIYDELFDDKKPQGKREPRCVGVHPAKWHLSLVNLIGKQGRSFVVERKVDAAVDNHPMYSYEMKYFNPNTGIFSDMLLDNVVAIDKKDQFKKFRHKDAKYIVGVETTMTYMHFMKPFREDKFSEEDDKEVDKKMLYDLELDKNFNIIGGQWRAQLIGKVKTPRIIGEQTRKDFNYKQPDFFWTLTKNFKESKLFDDKKGLEPWSDTTKAPPKTWKAAAIGKPLKGKQYAKGQTDGPHGYYFNQTMSYWGNPDTCRMLNKETGKFVYTYCDYRTNRPQPLPNIINMLIKLSK